MKNKIMGLNTAPGSKQNRDIIGKNHCHLQYLPSL